MRCDVHDQGGLARVRLVQLVGANVLHDQDVREHEIIERLADVARGDRRRHHRLLRMRPRTIAPRPSLSPCGARARVSDVCACACV